LARALGEPAERIQALLGEIRAEHEKPEHGVFVRYVRGGYQMRTKPEHHEDLQELLRELRPRAPLSLPALQTLAIIAYKQPVSAPEIQAIRRVEGAGVLQTLLKRKLIAPAGRKPGGGHALLYRTTPPVSDRFRSERSRRAAGPGGVRRTPRAVRGDRFFSQWNVNHSRSPSAAKSSARAAAKIASASPVTARLAPAAKMMTRPHSGTVKQQSVQNSKNQDIFLG
jgi:segregation and condensation protein B